MARNDCGLSGADFLRVCDNCASSLFGYRNRITTVTFVRSVGKIYFGGAVLALLRSPGQSVEGEKIAL